MHTIQTIDRLLKNELSVTDTYQHILDKFQDDSGMSKADCLIPIHNHHKNAVASLQAQIRELEGSPPNPLDVSTLWSKIIRGGAILLSKYAVLEIMLEVEKKIGEDYQTALINPELPLAFQCLIEWKLLLIQKSHIRILNKLLDEEPGRNHPLTVANVMV